MRGGQSQIQKKSALKKTSAEMNYYLKTELFGWSGQPSPSNSMLERKKHLILGYWLKPIIYVPYMNQNNKHLKNVKNQKIFFRQNCTPKVYDAFKITGAKMCLSI